MDFGREKDNMMISEKMAAAINDQIKAEFDSAYIYLGMAAYFQDCNPLFLGRRESRTPLIEIGRASCRERV